MKLVSVSILGSIYLPTLGNGVVVTLLFGIGMIGGFISRIPFSQTVADTMNHIGLVTSLLIPTNALYYHMVSELLGMGNLLVSTRDFSSVLGPFAGGRRRAMHSSLRESTFFSIFLTHSHDFIFKCYTKIQ
jgi:hypothetical protein